MKGFVEIKVTGFHVPTFVRLGAWLEEVDYTAPIWANIVALFAVAMTALR